MEDVKFLTAGDSGIIVQFKQEISKEINIKIRSFIEILKVKQIPGVIDTIPTFCSVLVNYDPRILLYDEIKDKLSRAVELITDIGSNKKKIVEIPVCYGGVFGPDIGKVAEHTGMTQEQIISEHTKPDYLIYMLGFLPGFSYLGGLNPELATPRLSVPRLRIEAGAVGIGGEQTGIYPLESPGGWNIIGKTPVKPYDKSRENPILYEAGDYIRFVSITSDEFDNIQKLVEKGQYKCRIIEGEN